MKYLLVLAVVWIGYHLWRKQRIADQTKPKAPARADPMVMVACTHCGTHLPQTEALAHDGRFYCGPEHRDRHVG